MNQLEEVTEEKKYECPICKVDGNIKHEDFFFFFLSADSYSSALLVGLKEED